MDEIEKPLGALWRSKLLQSILLLVDHLVKTYEGGFADSILAEECHTLLGVLDRVDDYVVQSWTCIRNCQVVFLWDGGEVPKSAVDTFELILLLSCH